MNGIFIALLGITLLFFVLLVVKEIIGKLFGRELKNKICVICGAVTLTWILLLTLYHLKLFDDSFIVAILLGQTSLGIFYLIEKKIKSELKLFRLPFLLTLIFIAYFLLVPFADLIPLLIFLAILWGAFSLIYLFRSNKNLNSFVKKLVECCKNW